MSNAHLSIWSALKSIFEDSRVKSLKPHWVSEVLTPQTTPLIKPKTAEINFLCILRSTLASYYKCFLEPTTIIKGFFTVASIVSIFLIILPSYEKVVAPSASTISILSPIVAAIPALTAPPFPLFLGYSTTNKFALSFLPVLRAA